MAVEYVEGRPPAYGLRDGWYPRCQSDFGGGGAYPEIHVAQFPLDMGRPGRSCTSEALAIQRDESGRVRHELVILQGSTRTVTYTRPDAQKEKWSDESSLRKPSREEIEKNLTETKDALEKVLMSRAQASQIEKAAASLRKEDEYIKYTADEGTPGYNPACAQRVIRLVERKIDPLEPPKFQLRRAPKGGRSPPPPIMRSPPRKLTYEDQQAWKIPPCVSNWKNQRGFTIPLDKRLQADGRGLQEVVVNESFASLAEALYVAERSAREEIRLKNQLLKQKQQMEETAREDKLRKLAAQARAERAGYFRDVDGEEPRGEQGRPSEIVREEQERSEGDEDDNSDRRRRSPPLQQDERVDEDEPPIPTTRAFNPDDRSSRGFKRRRESSSESDDETRRSPRRQQNWRRDDADEERPDRAHQRRDGEDGDARRDRRDADARRDRRRPLDESPDERDADDRRGRRDADDRRGRRDADDRRDRMDAGETRDRRDADERRDRRDADDKRGRRDADDRRDRMDAAERRDRRNADERRDRRDAGERRDVDESRDRGDVEGRRGRGDVEQRRDSGGSRRNSEIREDYHQKDKMFDSGGLNRRGFDESQSPEGTLRIENDAVGRFKRRKDDEELEGDVHDRRRDVHDRRRDIHVRTRDVHDRRGDADDRTRDVHDRRGDGDDGRRDADDRRRDTDDRRRDADDRRRDADDNILEEVDSNKRRKAENGGSSDEKFVGFGDFKGRRDGKSRPIENEKRVGRSEIDETSRREESRRRDMDNTTRREEPSRRDIDDTERPQESRRLGMDDTTRREEFGRRDMDDTTRRGERSRRDIDDTGRREEPRRRDMDDTTRRGEPRGREMDDMQIDRNLKDERRVRTLDRDSKFKQEERRRIREIEREFRMEKAGLRRRRLEEDREISERVALGQAQATNQEALFDARLFNQSSSVGGLDSGFKEGEDDEYNLFDRPLFGDRSVANREYQIDRERIRRNVGESHISAIGDDHLRATRSIRFEKSK